MNTTIKKYDKDSPLPSEMAEQITKFFKKNYPIYHSLENKEKDLSKRTSHKALNALLNEGRTIFTVQDVQKKVLGLLEMREINQGEGIYMQLVWIIVDTLAR